MDATMIDTKVAGVTFVDGYPQNLADLARRFTVGPIPVELVRDVDNAHDLNAVAVRIEGRHVGHLPAYVAAHIGPDLDAGVVWNAIATFVAVDLDHRNRPGLRLRLARKD